MAETRRFGEAVCALSSRPLFLTLVRCVCLSPPPSPPGPFAHAARPPPVCATRPACVSAPGHPGVPQEAPPRLPRKAHGPAGPPCAPAAWLHAVGFGVRDFVAVVRKASFLCVVLVTCTLSRGVPVVVCVFMPLRTAEGKRSPRPPPRLRTVFAPSTCFRNPPAACAPLSPAWPLSRVYWQVLCT